MKSGHLSRYDGHLGKQTRLGRTVHVGNFTSAFFKFSLNIQKFLFHVLLKPRLENFEHYFASV